MRRMHLEGILLLLLVGTACNIPGILHVHKYAIYKPFTYHIYISIYMSSDGRSGARERECMSPGLALVLSTL